MPKQPVGFKTASGASVTDYGLVGGILAVAVVTGATLVGGNPEEWPARIGLPGPSEVPATTVAGDSADKERVTVRLKNGVVLHLSSFPANVESAVRAQGASLTTHQLANALADAARQLHAQKHLSTRQAGHLYAVANQGHRIAEIEQVAEDMLVSGKPKLWQDKAISYDGRTYGSLEEFTDSLGAWPSEMPARKSKRPDKKASMWSGELGTLYNLIQDAGRAGALSDPEVNTLVTALVWEIGHISTSVQHAADDVYGHPENARTYTRLVSRYLEQQPARHRLSSLPVSRERDN